MIPTHLEAYQIALIAWGFLLGLYGVQGVLSVWLEGRELAPGSTERPQEPLWSLLAALSLAALVIAWGIKFAGELATAPPRQLALDAGVLFVGLASMLVVYRRYFVTDEAVAQDRDDGIPW